MLPLRPIILLGRRRGIPCSKGAALQPVPSTMPITFLFLLPLCPMFLFPILKGELQLIHRKLDIPTMLMGELQPLHRKLDILFGELRPLHRKPDILYLLRSHCFRPMQRFSLQYQCRTPTQFLFKIPKTSLSNQFLLFRE